MPLLHELFGLGSASGQSRNTLGYGSSAACRNDLDPDPSDTMLVDAVLPAVNQGFFYLITVEGPADAEGSLGRTTCAERSNFNACP